MQNVCIKRLSGGLGITITTAESVLNFQTVCNPEIRIATVWEAKNLLKLFYTNRVVQVTYKWNQVQVPIMHCRQ